MLISKAELLTQILLVGSLRTTSFDKQGRQWGALNAASFYSKLMGVGGCRDPHPQDTPSTKETCMS